MKKNNGCMIVSTTIASVWAVICGILLAVTGIVHYVKNDQIKYKLPSSDEIPQYYSQAGFAVSFNAAMCIVGGIAFVVSAIYSVLSVICDEKNKDSSLFTLYVGGGFIVFPLCGWLGFSVAIILWASIVVPIIACLPCCVIGCFVDSSLSDDE